MKEKRTRKEGSEEIQSGPSLQIFPPTTWHIDLYSHIDSVPAERFSLVPHTHVLIRQMYCDDNCRLLMYRSLKWLVCLNFSFDASNFLDNKSHLLMETEGQVRVRSG